MRADFSVADAITTGSQNTLHVSGQLCCRRSLYGCCDENDIIMCSRGITESSVCWGDVAARTVVCLHCPQTCEKLSFPRFHHKSSDVYKAIFALLTRREGPTNDNPTIASSLPSDLTARTACTIIRFSHYISLFSQYLNSARCTTQSRSFRSAQISRSTRILRPTRTYSFNSRASR